MSMLPTYEVEFIPLERRLREDRRKNPTHAYNGPERREQRNRRDGETDGSKMRQQA